ncbi:MAG: cellulase family glycosylhydrolase [Solirubrobacteraceae bacterium]|nr:cellulase family glycosylhydrolase [Solirubrobacteraceae bacterium]
MTRTGLLVGVLVLALLAGVAGLVVGRPGGGGGGDATQADTATPLGDAADPTPAPETGRGDSDAAEIAPGALPAFGPEDRLRVGGAKAGARRLVDSGRRQVHLRGTSVNALVDYGASHSAPVALRARDFEQMAALGFNVTRLAVSWSKVMPRPGQLDRAYLRRISSLVRQAGRQRIYTVISMHSDRYAADLGTGTEFDGAPAWAVFTDGQPCGDPRPRYYTACAAAAARHFYDGESVSGRRGVDWYADAVVAVARAGRRGGAGYAGTDILNEPTDPDASPDRLATPAWTARLHALQRTVVRRLRADGERAPVWIQPQGPRSVGASNAAVLPDLGDEDQVVYAPHAYIDVYDGTPNAGTADRLRAQYARFADEATRLRAATVIGEFPGATGGPWEELRKEHLARQQRSGFGGIAWLWKQPADGYGWGTLTPDGGLRADTNAAQVLSAARLLAGDRRTRVTTDGSGTVEIQAGPEGGSVDVWLGTAFDDAPAPTDRYRLENAAGATLTSAWRAEASLAGASASGVVARLSLPAGARSVRLVPGG